MLENILQTITNFISEYLPLDFLPEEFLLPDYLPILLLLLGFVLLIFCIIWMIAQHHAARKARKNSRKEKKSRTGVSEMLQPEQMETERGRRLEEIIQVQKQQIDSMQSQLDGAAKLRHDFRQELLALQEFARNGDREALDRYLPQVTLDGGAVTLPICPNPLINTLLQFYFNKARAAGIEIDAAVEADEDLWISASDVGVLFGNLLENGVTAAAEAPAGQRRLRLRTAQTADWFVIAMGNTFGAPRSLEENGAFASTKPNHTGIGLGSIRSVALQYDGEAKFLLDGDMFMSYIILLRPYES